MAMVKVVMVMDVDSVVDKGKRLRLRRRCTVTQQTRGVSPSEQSQVTHDGH